MKTLAVMSVVGFLAGLGQPALAQAAQLAPMPWTAQLGVCGGCLTILLLVVTRVIPQMARENGKAVRDAAATSAAAVDRLRDDLNEHQGQMVGLLREVLSEAPR
ncbi:MAG: hypothetical protein IT424_11220 [Pirellulales bacterium]|nr:hypothetical protein [Pirellulales bacterium]